MAVAESVQILLYFIVLLAIIPSVGTYMASVFSHESTPLAKVLGPLERGIYRICLIDAREVMHWKKYALTIAALSCVSLVATFALQLVQTALPFNPQHLPNVSWALAFNTATSFVTNTNWQAYSGESTLAYGVQLFALTVQNFVSAAVGMCVLLVVIRALSRERTSDVGNAWVDLVRTIVYVLLPLALVFALFLVSQGVVQNVLPYVMSKGLEGASQLLPMGPAASQVAIKQLGTNGGGFFGVNSAHPFENPTALTNFVQMLGIILIPASQVYMFGVMTKARKHSVMIFIVMLSVVVMGLLLSLWSQLPLGLEGQELRFGKGASVLWSMVTTAASNGSVNAMLDSLSPLAGGVGFLNIVLGEVIFGGVGAGLYGMFLFVLLTVFLAGLMVGRTPEYFGKKLEVFEMKWTLLALIIPSAVVLLGAALSLVLPEGLKGLLNHGPHGMMEMLYAFASAAQNNGSAFAGLGADSFYFNIVLAIAMLIGRFVVIFSVLAIAGSLIEKVKTPPTMATFATDAPIFAVLLWVSVLIVGALTFVPALALSSLAEYFLMLSGASF